MPQIINTNIASLNAQRNLNNSQRLGDTALQRLSSGLRINSAKDDAAGLAISTRFEAQSRGTSVAIRNAGDGISLAQTAESALNSMTTNLQRIRELALQSSNDTNSDIDRAALQQEVSQLVDEIKNIAEKTNFNGKKLLDGSFQNAVFQTGANVGDTISVSVAKLDTSTLGSAAGAGLSSTVSTSPIYTGTSGNVGETALSGGDLVINGVAVGASSGADDDASTAFASSSAIAKAAAINKVSDRTGVTAVVNENRVAGSGANYDDDASGTLTLNNVTFNLANSSTLTAEQNMKAVADIINQKSDLTGVRAEFVSTSQGVALIAADGRNITMNFSGAATADNTDDFGLAALSIVGPSSTASVTATTYAGSFTLISEDGSDIVISSDTGNIDNAGLEEGTFSGVNGGAVSDAASDTTRQALAVGDLVINGVAVGATSASDDTASSAGNDASAIAVAAAINRVSDQTGVSAKAAANTLYSGNLTTTTASASILLNGVTVSVSFNTGDDIAVKQQAIIDAINGESGRTGVTAEALDSDSFKLIAADGRNIAISNGTLMTGIAADTYVSGVVLESAGQFTLSSQTGNISRSGFREGTFGGGEFGQKLEDIDISTVKGANDAIQAVDNALQTITSKQAELGAVQNRFQNTISNLEALNENLNAANSRIRDADFASETAALSKAQVLQQAGISVLAQANARPQQVLSLLQ